jgi:hypothetical protein
MEPGAVLRDTFKTPADAAYPRRGAFQDGLLYAQSSGRVVAVTDAVGQF